MYQLRVVFSPTAGKERELGTLLENWVKKRQGAGDRLNLAMQAFSPHGVTYAMSILYNDLAAVDELRHRLRDDREFQGLTDQIANLTRAPVEQSIYEVVVPMPAQ